jgi:flavin-dependent dehydrogenase
MRADVAIAGASFAGLSLAYYLKESGLDVLLIDEKDVGAKRTSTCGAPLSLVKNLAKDSILNKIGSVHIETKRLRRTIELSREYCLIDYKKFCTSLLKKSGARFLNATAKGATSGILETSAGSIKTDFIVDCTGWRRSLSKNKSRQKFFSGVEITVPIRQEHEKSLNFYINKDLIPGYAWVFPLGNGIGRVGIGGDCSREPLNKALMKFLDLVEIPFENNDLVGGIIPCTGLGAPVENGMFFVGDSAREVLPLSGEGIRTSTYFAHACAYAIKQISRKKMTRQEGLDYYVKLVQDQSSGFFAMGLLQNALIYLPQSIIDFGFFMSTIKPLQKPLMNAYFLIARL